jgi:hypothetical protein
MCAVLPFPQRAAVPPCGGREPGGAPSLPRRAPIPPFGDPTNHAEEIALARWLAKQEKSK